MSLPLPSSDAWHPQPVQGGVRGGNGPDSEKQLDGIELLLEMTKSGEIDPWNIDIVKVADQYLQAVAELKESDLKITGKTLLYLAILLRMKSDSLAGINYLNPPEENEFLDELLEPDFMDGKAVQPKFQFQSLDEVIKRRTSTKQPRIRTVTLNDLIRELKRYEELEKRRSLREKVERSSERRMMDYADFTADDIEEMAHEEFIEDTILHLKNILERILIHQEEVSLTEIVEEGKIDKISAFLALLFLAARGDFSMHQDEFYAELYVRPDAQVMSSDLEMAEDMEPLTQEEGGARGGNGPAFGESALDAKTVAVEEVSFALNDTDKIILLNDQTLDDEELAG